MAVAGADANPRAPFATAAAVITPAGVELAVGARIKVLAQVGASHLNRVADVILAVLKPK